MGMASITKRFLKQNVHMVVELKFSRQKTTGIHFVLRGSARNVQITQHTQQHALTSHSLSQKPFKKRDNARIT